MAYENYTQVSWSAGTPITGDRLQQMSQNIQEVKDATDDKPKGIIKFKSITTSFNSNTTGTGPTGLGTLISLYNEGVGNPNNSLTLDQNRYIKIVLNFPGFAVSSYGQEDALYELILIENDGTSNTTLATWDFSSGPLIYVNTAASASALMFTGTTVVANISNLLTGNKIPNNNASVVTSTTVLSNSSQNLKTRSSGNKQTFGAGQYEYLKSTGAGMSNYSYYVNVNRLAGANSNNSSSFIVVTSAPTQLYVEDAGGTA